MNRPCALPCDGIAGHLSEGAAIGERLEQAGVWAEKLLDAVVGYGLNCECDDPDCIKTIPMPIAEFTKIERNRFIVLPGHENPQAEEVMTRHNGYVVVAKAGAGREYVRNNF